MFFCAVFLEIWFVRLSFLYLAMAVYFQLMYKISTNMTFLFIVLFQSGIETKDEVVTVKEITNVFKNKSNGKFNGMLSILRQ